MKTYPAVVLAGYAPDRPDPLAVAMGGDRKALLDLVGKPMVWWVVDALRQSKRIGPIFIVGMSPEDGVDFGVDVQYVPNQTSHFDNIMAGVNAAQDNDPTNEFLMGVSGDIPLLKAETIDWFVQVCEDMGGDFFYSFVQDKTMESQFPGSARSFVPLKEGRFCGGDLSMARAAIAKDNEQLIRDLLDRRKNAFQQVRLAGFGTVIKFLFRRLSVHDIEKVAARLIQCNARAVQSPYADLGMDIDKPQQLEMARRILAARAQAG
ncbi:MAG: nucleotidyltransferase family protein [Caldilineales bacterium]|nr:nucleotidyltransferase family protein [Caldilineales bacterium]